MFESRAMSRLHISKLSLPVMHLNTSFSIGTAKVLNWIEVALFTKEPSMLGQHGCSLGLGGASMTLATQMANAARIAFSPFVVFMA